MAFPEALIERVRVHVLAHEGGHVPFLFRVHNTLGVFLFCSFFLKRCHVLMSYLVIFFCYGFDDFKEYISIFPT
jgi:hypothetical protein